MVESREGRSSRPFSKCFDCMKFWKRRRRREKQMDGEKLKKKDGGGGRSSIEADPGAEEGGRGSQQNHRS